MTQYGNPVHGWIETAAEVVPTVGMGLTIILWTDRHAGTVTWVSPSGKTIRYRRDRVTRVDSNGLSEAQEYRFEADPEATECTARLTKRGWRDHGDKLVLGHRSEYRDFSF